MRTSHLVRVAFGFLLVALLTGVVAPSAAAQAAAVDRVTLTAPFELVNPCNDEVVSGAVQVNVIYVSTPALDTVILRVQGNLDGSEGTSYGLTVVGSDVFTEPSSTGTDGSELFDFATRGVAASRGALDTFAIDGRVRVIVQDRQVVGAMPLSISPECRG